MTQSLELIRLLLGLLELVCNLPESLSTLLDLPKISLSFSDLSLSLF